MRRWWRIAAAGWLWTGCGEEPAPFACGEVECGAEEFCRTTLPGTEDGEVSTGCVPLPEECSNDRSCECLLDAAACTSCSGGEAPSCTDAMP